MRAGITLIAVAATLALWGLAEGAHAEDPRNERREWFPQWGKAWARSECSAVQQHLSEGLEQGDPLAHELSGIMIITRACSNEGLDRAFSHFRIAAEAGRERSMLRIAKLYSLGKGTRVDERESRRWAQKAILAWVDTDPADRRERLASAMEHDIPPTIQAEFNRLELLMSRSAEDKLTIGVQIEHGHGFVADPQRACLWRLSAAKENSAAAQFALAEQLLEGRGVPTNLGRGIDWLHHAASAGNADAQARLGVVLTKGEYGVRKDPHAAYRWLTRAKAAGRQVEDTLAEASSSLKPKTVDFLRDSAFEVTSPAPKVNKGVGKKECV